MCCFSLLVSWFHVFTALCCSLFFLMESRGPGSDAKHIAPTLVPLCPMISKCSSSRYEVFNILVSACFLEGRNVYMCTFLLWCWTSGATNLRNKNVHFVRQYNESFRTYRYLLADIRIIFTVIRIILTDNFYGAPWGNAAV